MGIQTREHRVEVQYLLHNPSEPNLTYIIGTNFDDLKNLRHLELQSKALKQSIVHRSTTGREYMSEVNTGWTLVL